MTNDSAVSKSVTSNSSFIHTEGFWTFRFVYFSFVFFAVLLTNIPVLLVYACNKSLRSNPFSIYLINLLLANLYHAIFEHPLDIVFTRDAGQKHDSEFCSAYICSLYITGALMLNTHLLITLNRIWAMTFPIPYRQFHTKTTAVAVCLFVWFYVHVVVVPGIIVDAVFYRESGDNERCLINTKTSKAQAGWDQFIVVIHLFPILCIALAYPFIWWKRYRRTQKRIRSSSDMASDKVDVLIMPEVQSGAVLVREKAVELKPATKTSQSFLVLTLLTASLLICWTPLAVFFTLSVLGFATVPLLYDITMIWWVLEPVIDPVLFTIALKDLREALVSFYCRRSFYHRS